MCYPLLPVAETKIETSLPATQFFLEGYHSPYRLDVSHKTCGLLVYVKATIPSRQLSLPKFQFRIKPYLELNLRKEKWLVISIYSAIRDFIQRTLVQMILIQRK